MPVSPTWTSPAAGGTLDLATGSIMTEGWVDAVASNFLYLAGASGLLAANMGTSGALFVASDIVMQAATGGNLFLNAAQSRGLQYISSGDYYQLINPAAKLIVGQATGSCAQVDVNGVGTSSWAGYANGNANAPGTLGTPGGVLLVNDSGVSAGDGGVVLFGAGNGSWFAGIKGFLVNGSNNGTGDLSFAIRRNTTDTALTEMLRISSTGFIDSPGSWRLGNGGAGVSLSSSTTPPASGVLMGSLPSFVSGDHYLVIDAAGNVHRSAIGPAS